MWRRLLRRCSFKKDVCKIILFGFFASAMYAQKSPLAPVAPVAPVMDVESVGGIKMPEMPSMSTSMPNFQNQYVPGKKQSSMVKTEQAKENTSDQITDSKSDAEIEKNEIISKLNNLTANDLAMIAENGMFPNLSSIIQNDSFNLDNSSGSQSLVLKEILTELNQIKETQNKLLNNSSLKNTIIKNGSGILRFIINNQDILASCNSVYFSKEEMDGSFLLTGDCKSMYNNNVLAETFYMLFKSNGTEDGKSLFNVEVMVSQNYKNENSPLYKFSQQKNYVAKKTGNLIVLRKVDNQIRCDVLIDIGK